MMFFQKGFFRVFSKETEKENIVVNVPAIETWDIHEGGAKVSAAHQIAQSLVETINLLRTENGEQRNRIKELEHINASLNAEIGDYLREKEEKKYV